MAKRFLDVLRRFPAAALLVVLVFFMIPGREAVQWNLTNLRLLAAAASSSGVGDPRCTEDSGPAEVSSPYGERGRLIQAKRALLRNDCEAAMAYLEGMVGDEADRLKAAVCLALKSDPCFRSALSAFGSPGLASALLQTIGLRQSRAGEHSSAVESFALAQRFAPVGPLPLRQYATSLQALGRYADATALFRGLLEGDPGDAESRYLLGVVLWEAGPGSLEAIAELERAVELRDYFPYRYRLGTFYLALGRLADARQQFLLVLAGGVARFDALNALGDVAAAEGRSDDAISRYSEALAINPRDDVRAKLRQACESTTTTGQSGCP